MDVKKSIKESKDMPLIESQVSDNSQPKQPFGPVKGSYQNFGPLTDLRGIESDPAFNKAAIIEQARIINTTPKCHLNLNVPNFVRSSAINEIVTERTLHDDKSKNQILNPDHFEDVNCYIQFSHHEVNIGATGNSVDANKNKPSARTNNFLK